MINLDILMLYQYYNSMRTTIRINEYLLEKAKKVALENHTTVSSIIEEALREKLFRMNQNSEKKPVNIITFKGNGLLPGVDLDDTSTLLDLME